MDREGRVQWTRRVAGAVRLAVSGLLLMAGACDRGDGPATDRLAQASTTTSTAAPVELGGAPETFFAVKEERTQLVEVETATGRVRRTLVDFGPYREASAGSEQGSTWIDALDLAPDGRTLWYSAGATYLDGRSVFRIALPDGAPERVLAGQSPSVSPDGRVLAWVDGKTIKSRDLGSGAERIVVADVGLEAHDTTWSSDGSQLAYLSGGADSFGTAVVHLATGHAVHLAPTEKIEGVFYTPYGAKYRPSDGLLAVICCGEAPDPPPDYRPGPPALVFHNPVTGAERNRLALPAGPSAHDYTHDGSHHLVAAGGRVYLDREGELSPIPGLDGVLDLTW